MIFRNASTSWWHIDASWNATVKKILCFSSHRKFPFAICIASSTSLSLACLYSCVHFFYTHWHFCVSLLIFFLCQEERHQQCASISDLTNHTLLPRKAFIFNFWMTIQHVMANNVWFPIFISTHQLSHSWQFHIFSPHLTGNGKVNEQLGGTWAVSQGWPTRKHLCLSNRSLHLPSLRDFPSSPIFQKGLPSTDWPLLFFCSSSDKHFSQPLRCVLSLNRVVIKKSIWAGLGIID